MIATFELLKEKSLSRTTAFAKHISLGISLTKNQIRHFFPHKHYCGLKLYSISSLENESTMFVKLILFDLLE